MDIYKVFIEQGPNAIAMFDTDMRYLMVSHQWLKDYQISLDSIIGKSHYEIFPEIIQEWKDIHQDCLAGCEHQCPEFRFVRSDGSEQWISWEIKPWYTADRKIGGIIMYTSIITERKALEKELSIQQDQFRGAFETSAIGMAIVSLEGQFIKANTSLLHLLGYDRRTLYHLSFQQITHPDDLQKDLLLLQELLQGRKDHYQLEKRYFRKDGELIWVLLSVSIVRDISSNPIHFVSQVIDITETKRINHLRLLKLDEKNSRIAYELHENIAQTLASVKLLLASSKTTQPLRIPDNPTIEQQLSSLITDIQHLAGQFVPTTFINDRFSDLLHGLTAKYSIPHEVQIKMDLPLALEELRFPVSFQLCCLIEELLKAFILKKATSIHLSFKVLNTLTIICVENGLNGDSYSSDTELKLLFSNINLRTEMLGGIFKYPETHGHTTTYTIHLPAPQNNLADQM